MLYFRSGDNCAMIELLFERLDHPCCKNSVDDWRMLFKTLKRYKKHLSSPEWNKIKDCINERKSWWPKYHFINNNLHQFEINDKSQRRNELSKYKRKIGKYFKRNGIFISLNNIAPFASFLLHLFIRTKLVGEIAAIKYSMGYSL